MLAVDVAGGSVRALMDVAVKSERERIKSARLCIIFSAVGPRGRAETPCQTGSAIGR